MEILKETYTLNNGVTIPKIAFGTWQMPNDEVGYDSVAFALKSGYVHIDTARVYGNEEVVGKAIKDSGIDRKDIFVTTKLPAEQKTYDQAMSSFELSLKELGLDYVDLYLIHAPWPWSDRGSDHMDENIEVWKAFEELYKSGRAKSIGVSNFNVRELQTLIDATDIVPAVNQIKFHIGDTKEDLMAYCEQHGIIVEAYSPLATGRILDNEEIKAMADRYGKTVAQICIGYTLQRGTITLPKSVHEEYILENGDVNFEISQEDMAFLNNLKDLD
ncbi:aldo/keto reductase [Candidatus Saccharibacteria bacterium]|nr:aldo/keto reductase [Candidatus Saccharibacteria bacterium]